MVTQLIKLDYITLIVIGMRSHARQRPNSWLTWWTKWEQPRQCLGRVTFPRNWCQPRHVSWWMWVLNFSFWVTSFNVWSQFVNYCHLIGQSTYALLWETHFPDPDATQFLWARAQEAHHPGNVSEHCRHAGECQTASKLPVSRSYPSSHSLALWLNCHLLIFMSSGTGCRRSPSRAKGWLQGNSISINL